MAKITVSASVLQNLIGEKFKNQSHIVLSFVRKGFKMSNKIKIDEQRQDIEIFIKKKKLLVWDNTDSINIHAIGKL